MMNRTALNLVLAASEGTIGGRIRCSGSDESGQIRDLILFCARLFVQQKMRQKPNRKPEQCRNLVAAEQCRNLVAGSWIS